SLLYFLDRKGRATGGERGAERDAMAGVGRAEPRQKSLTNRRRSLYIIVSPWRATRRTAAAAVSEEPRPPRCGLMGPGLNRVFCTYSRKRISQGGKGSEYPCGRGCARDRRCDERADDGERCHGKGGAKFGKGQGARSRRSKSLSGLLARTPGSAVDRLVASPGRCIHRMFWFSVVG
ncbi:unnamed protein product, partial [Ectocarpus sp. 6 AP-2014]